LKGVKPGDIPIEEVTDYKLVINRRVARQHGMDIPQTVLLRADKIIE
jgi:putative tryptophan/tyrosine transport system substrate-binding protein